MKVIIIIIVGVLGGIIGGMGMGGGTLLIPLLTTFAGFSQRSAQALNLLAFIPMSIVAIAIHAKNGLIDFKKILPVALPAVMAGIGGAFLSKVVKSTALSKYFGIFLCALGVYRLAAIIISYILYKKNKCLKNEKLPVHDTPDDAK